MTVLMHSHPNTSLLTTERSGGAAANWTHWVAFEHVGYDRLCFSVINIRQKIVLLNLPRALMRFKNPWCGEMFDESGEGLRVSYWNLILVSMAWGMVKETENC